MEEKKEIKDVITMKEKDDQDTIKVSFNVEKEPSKPKSALKIVLQIVFWIISVPVLLLGFIGIMAGEYATGIFLFLGAIVINPLIEKIKFKADKFKTDKFKKNFNILIKLVGFILIIIGFVFFAQPIGRFRIKNNALVNSREEIKDILNSRLKEYDEQIEKFEEVVINDVGKENNYKMYEAKLDKEMGINLIEYDGKVEAIRTYAKSAENSSKKTNLVGFIIGVVMNESGVSPEDGDTVINKLASEIDENNFNSEIVTESFSIVMKSADSYTRLTMIYNNSNKKLIESINSEELEILEEKEFIKSINNFLESSYDVLAEPSSTIEFFKDMKLSVEEIKEYVLEIKLKHEKDTKLQESWLKTIEDIVKKINAKITVKVPNFNTLLFDEAESWGKKNNVEVDVKNQYSTKVANKKLISQSVKAGQTIVKEEDSIVIIYSLGREPTIGEKNALKKAESYSELMHMSKQGIYKQLISKYGEKFPVSEAKYAIEHIQANWKYNALEKAKSYQENLNMSKQAIYDQLVSPYGEEFTHAEAKYAIDRLD